ncbi:MAG: response regulator [Acidimicrobiales bacterium]|nr:response regulator [Actinomycetota bacterium]
MPRILLVEDNRTNQIVAVGNLHKLGYDVDIADSGADAVPLLLAVRYDAVLMDVMMPGIDGYEATRQIRDLEATHHMPRVPVVGLSARALPQDRAVALDAGMDDYLTKPLCVAALGETLRRLIAGSLVGP